MSPIVRRVAALTAASLLLWGCGSYPLAKVFVLGAPAQTTPGVVSEASLPVFELDTVSVPDYLDTTDILRRSGSNEVIASPTGRWGERVSLGVTHALSSALARRLPRVVVETRSAYEPSRRILIDLERFEIDPDGKCTLIARWRITTADGKTALASEEGAFTEMASSASDAAAAAAMTLATDQLADHVAITIQGALSTAPR